MLGILVLYFVSISINTKERTLNVLFDQDSTFLKEFYDFCLWASL